MGVVLPIAFLAGFGWLWLWERGYALIWVFVTLGLTAIGLLASFLTVRWLERGSDAIAGDETAVDSTHVEEDGTPVYSPREAAAWAAVEVLADEVDPATLENREAVLSLGVKTVEAVARQIHPDKHDAVWRFTVPEALTLIERVSTKLKPMIVENIPLGDQLSVGQVLRIYRWRSVVDLANKAYDIWRIVRFMNPIAAATNEIRERLTKSIYSGVREELAKRLAAAYVREVGRAAIDLYGGRLRVNAETLAAHVSAASIENRAALTKPAEPLRILVAGQNGVGKSSLINELAGEIAVPADVLPSNNGYVPVQVSREGLPELLLVDAPGLTSAAADLERLGSEARAADLIVWVAGANRADRHLDKTALAAIDSYFKQHSDRRAAPKLFVISHIDLLRPAREWSPPYDLTNTDNAKARSIADAVNAVAADLGFDAGHAVPVCVSEQAGLYNIDLVWAKIAELLPEAKRAHFVRVMSEARDEAGLSWRRVLGQAAGAGRLLAGALKHELTKR